MRTVVFSVFFSLSLSIFMDIRCCAHIDEEWSGKGMDVVFVRSAMEFDD